MFWRRKRSSAAVQEPPRGGRDTSRPTRGYRFRWIRGRRYVEGSSYIGAKDAEADQFLDFQHFLVRRVLGGNHHSPLTQPRLILDVGCGTGRWVVEMATEFPGAQVVGLDLVTPGKAEAMLHTLGPLAANVSFVEADALKRLPFSDGTFDFVQLRLMYSDLPAASYPAVMRELMRVTRPGGWIECVEPGENIYDPGPAYQLTNRWTAELCRRRGLDPDMGPRLKYLLQEVGAVRVSEHVLSSFSDLTMTRERRLWQTQCLGVLNDVFRDPIIEAGIASAADYDNALQALRLEFDQGHHANSDPLYVTFGQRPTMSYPLAEVQSGWLSRQ